MADPDLERSGGGAWGAGGGGGRKILFWLPLPAFLSSVMFSFLPKIRREQAPSAPPLDPPRVMKLTA